MVNKYSLYIHIPFCKSKCNYCDFNSFAGKEGLIPDYIGTLKRELDFYSMVLEIPYLSTIYFGGGTPTMLPPESLHNILEWVRSKFALPKEPEITLEANPESVNFRKLLEAKNAGANRLSLGAQSFNDDILKSLGRIHSSSHIQYAFNTARMAGFSNIGLDLIFALPGQTLPDWKETLEKVTFLDPEHISTYNLVIEDGTPFYKNKNSLNLPDIDLEYEMFHEAINFLIDRGFEHYEISNFAKPGKRCKGNETYWRNEEYIGVGAGATSYIGGNRYTNPAGLAEYIKSWGNGIPKVIEDGLLGGKTDMDLEVRETIFLGLRLIEGIDLAALDQRFGIDVKKKYESEIEELIENNLLEIKGTNLKLTKKGLFLADEVFLRFV